MKAFMKALCAIAMVSAPAWAQGQVERAGERVDKTAVKASDPANDTVITTRVKKKLWSDPLVKSDKIEVSTNKGAVELKGWVHSEKERERAISLAKKTKGVEQVTASLDVHKG